MSVLDYCSKCSAPLVAKCPCGRSECQVSTPVRVCPTCDPDAFARWNKMHGIKVCEFEVKKQLGLP